MRVFRARAGVGGRRQTCLEEQVLLAEASILSAGLESHELVLEPAEGDLEKALRLYRGQGSGYGFRFGVQADSPR